MRFQEWWTQRSPTAVSHQSSNFAAPPAMLFSSSVHPWGLDPFQAARAWHMRAVQGMAWKEVRSLVRTVSGMRPGQDALEDAVARADTQRHTAAFKKCGAAKSGYANCGRAPLLTPDQKQAVVALAQQTILHRKLHHPGAETDLQWKTDHCVLNEAGYHWRPVTRKGKQTPAQLAARKTFVDAAQSRPDRSFVR